MLCKVEGTQHKKEVIVQMEEILMETGIETKNPKKNYVNLFIYFQQSSTTPYKTILASITNDNRVYGSL